MAKKITRTLTWTNATLTVYDKQSKEIKECNFHELGDLDEAGIRKAIKAGANRDEIGNGVVIDIADITHESALYAITEQTFWAFGEFVKSVPYKHKVNEESED